MIAAEGVTTEPQVFTILKDRHAVIRVTCLAGRHDHYPPQVRKRMEDHLRWKASPSSKEACLVVDEEDAWTDEPLIHLHGWPQVGDDHGFALGNPKFETRLLLHVGDGTHIASSRDCRDLAEAVPPGYAKGISGRNDPRDRIDAAIRRARLRDDPRYADRQRALGGTTAYRLVETMLRI